MLLGEHVLRAKKASLTLKKLRKAVRGSKNITSTSLGKTGSNNVLPSRGILWAGFEIFAPAHFSKLLVGWGNESQLKCVKFLWWCWYLEESWNLDPIQAGILFTLSWA